MAAKKTSNKGTTKSSAEKKKPKKKFHPHMTAAEMHYEPYVDKIKKSMFSGVVYMCDKVEECVKVTEKMYDLYLNEKFEESEAMHQTVQDLEFEADNIKTTIRDKMPKRLFSQIAPEVVSNLLRELDGIADSCEDVADLLILRRTTYPPEIKKLINSHSKVVHKTVLKLHDVVHQTEHLIKRSFRKKDVDKIQEDLYHVATYEWEADKIKKKLRKALYAQEGKMSTLAIYQSLQVLHYMDRIADHAENVEGRIRSLVAG